MKSNNIKSLRKLSTGELTKELKAAEETIFKLRFQKVVEEVGDTSQIRKTRKKIAQIQTILQEAESQKSRLVNWPAFGRVRTRLINSSLC